MSETLGRGSRGDGCFRLATVMMFLKRVAIEQDQPPVFFKHGSLNTLPTNWFTV